MIVVQYTFDTVIILQLKFIKLISYTLFSFIRFHNLLLFFSQIHLIPHSLVNTNS